MEILILIINSSILFCISFVIPLTSFITKQIVYLQRIIVSFKLSQQLTMYTISLMSFY